MRPKDFPPHNTVFYYFNKWKLECMFEELMGRKEHIVVDAHGLPMSVVVHEANVQDSVGAELTVVLRPDESSKKFSVLPLRWIVERSFSWLETFEESPWITSSILIRARRWFNLPSVDSCITNCATKI